MVKDQLVSKKLNIMEKMSIGVPHWIGTPQSILFHTLFFLGIFALNIIGFGFDQILLILTTAVSLEAIYLAIFIQMTVNKNTKSLEEVEADLDEIQEDVEDLEEDIDVIQAEDQEDNVFDKKTQDALSTIEGQLQTLLTEIEQLKAKGQNGLPK